MFCRNCGKEVHNQAVACPGCGVPPRLERKFCHNCGGETQPNQVMCTKCGTALSPAGAPGQKEKVVAGLLGIFLGCLGIHKFYLGLSGPGVAMVLITIIGGVLTCGVASSVMYIIGLVEGILYLTKTDQEFERDYVRGKRGWF